jgi:nucleotide-binding universal stress UspA family protein
MFNTIVWATDGSAHADRALEYARQLLTDAADRGTLHVTHISEKLVGPRVAGLDAHLDESEIEARIRGQAWAAEQEGLRVQLHIIPGHEGEIARRIAEEAAAAGADVIVVGTRGHSAVVAAVIGSVTQGLLHVAPCPVLAVPPLRAGHRSGETAETVLTPAR